MLMSRLLLLLSCLLLIPNLGSAECTALPKNNSLYTPLACTFDDVVGTWTPLSEFMSQWGDIEIKEHEIVYVKDKNRAPLIVIHKDHLIIIHKDGGYHRVEIKVSTFNAQTVLCFHEYNDLKDAQSSTDKVTAINCYGR